MRDAAAELIADHTETIFEGTVEKQEVVSGPMGPPSDAFSMTPADAHRVVTFLVTRTYRGHADSRVTIITGLSDGDCGYDFETGKQYLVHATRDNTGNLFFTNMCTRTAEVEKSGPAIRLLRGDPPAPDDLLDPQTYERKYFSIWTATMCGRVTKPDGSPMARASVHLSQVRDEPLPPKEFADENGAGPDGSFCIQSISPGKYLLTAEETNYDTNTRWMAYFPGVPHSFDAKIIDIAAGANISGIQFTVQQQPLYTVRFKIATPDGSPLPWRCLSIAIDSPERDRLAYHEDHGINEDGSYTLGLIPPGHYRVSSFVMPDFQTDQISPEALKWKMANLEVDISGNTEIVLKLVPAAKP